jgi:hypothetical protein
MSVSNYNIDDDTGPFPHRYENADFSPETIKGSIREGKMKQMKY